MIVEQISEIKQIACPPGEFTQIETTINDNGEIHLIISDLQTNQKIALLMYSDVFNKIKQEMDDLAKTYIIE